MKNTLYGWSFLCLLMLTLVMGLSSFGSVPNATADDHRIRSKEQRLQNIAAKRQARREARLDIRRERLTYRMEQSDKETQKMRLQRRLDRIDRLKAGGNPVFGIIAGVSGGLAVTGPFLFLISGLTVWYTNQTLAWGLMNVAVFSVLIGGLIAIALGIVGMVLAKKKSDKFSGFKGSLAGLILGGIAFFLMFFFLFIMLIMSGFSGY